MPIERQCIDFISRKMRGWLSVSPLDRLYGDYKALGTADDADILGVQLADLVKPHTRLQADEGHPEPSSPRMCLAGLGIVIPIILTAGEERSIENVL